MNSAPGKLLRLLHDAITVLRMVKRQQDIIGRFGQCKVSILKHSMDSIGRLYIVSRYIALKVYRLPIYFVKRFLKKVIKKL